MSQEFLVLAQFSLTCLRGSHPPGRTSQSGRTNPQMCGVLTTGLLRPLSSWGHEPRPLLQPHAVLVKSWLSILFFHGDLEFAQEELGLCFALPAS